MTAWQGSCVLVTLVKRLQAYRHIGAALQSLVCVLHATHTDAFCFAADASTGRYSGD